MAKVFPNALVPSGKESSKSNNVGRGEDEVESVVLTVWKKSLMLNCKGFTVFGSTGDLVYRVDNYLAGNSGEIVLMDFSGKPLLTIRRKQRLGLGDSWMVYEGEKTVDPRFSVRRQVNFRNSKTLAHVNLGNGGTTSSPTASPPLSPRSSSSPRKNAVYEIEGSYAQRSVSVYDNARRCVAEIKQKQAASGVALGMDVFTLIVFIPYIETHVAMALVIILDQMFGSSSPSSSKRHSS